MEKNWLTLFANLMLTKGRKMTMKAIDVLVNKNRILLYCVGNDISDLLSCRKISINGRSYSVIKAGMYYSISDVNAALVQIDAKTNQEIALGEIIVLG